MDDFPSPSSRNSLSDYTTMLRGKTPDQIASKIVIDRRDLKNSIFTKAELHMHVEMYVRTYFAVLLLRLGLLRPWYKKLWDRITRRDPTKRLLELTNEMLPEPLRVYKTVERLVFGQEPALDP